MTNDKNNDNDETIVIDTAAVSEPNELIHLDN
jgi:hypothetical protein